MTLDSAVELIERYNLPDLPTLADLPTEDGIPLETNWHRIQMNLLIDLITQRWRHVQNFFAGGNMFIYKICTMPSCGLIPKVACGVLN